MSTDHDTTSTQREMPKPLWMRVEAGERLSFGDWFRWNVMRPFSGFAWRVRVTPKLRERCVDYALQGGAKGWSVTDDAARIADFIASGRGR